MTMQETNGIPRTGRLGEPAHVERFDCWCNPGCQDFETRPPHYVHRRLADIVTQAVTDMRERAACVCDDAADGHLVDPTLLADDIRALTLTEPEGAPA